MKGCFLFQWGGASFLSGRSALHGGASVLIGGGGVRKKWLNGVGVGWGDALPCSPHYGKLWVRVATQGRLSIEEHGVKPSACNKQTYID